MRKMARLKMHTMLKFATYMGPHGKHMRILSMKASARWDENLKYNWKVTVVF